MGHRVIFAALRNVVAIGDHHARLRAHQAPGIPWPSDLGGLNVKGETCAEARRGCEAVSMERNCLDGDDWAGDVNSAMM